MDDTVSARKTRVVAAALAQDLLGGERLLAGFVDVEAVGEVVRDLQAAFPAHFMHAFAAKAGCLEGILRLRPRPRHGLRGGEPGRAGAGHASPASSPAASSSIRRRRPGARSGPALRHGMTLNIDNWQELARVDTVMGEEPGSRSVIGVRINPQVGVGTIAAMSTATRTSKFGIALDDPGSRARILEAYRQRPWLTCVHTHVGSQGCPLELIAGGVGKAVALARGDQRRRRPAPGDHGRHRRRPAGQFRRATRSRPTFAEYAAILRAAAPALFSGEFKVITEFGRSILAKNGFIVARVEYTKTTGGRPIAITHAGAQVATRTVFMPELWAIRVSALDPPGRPKAGAKVEQDVAGPCCFAGDIIASHRLLPLLEPDDWVLLHDTGAYYFSTPFVYNSLPRVAVHGFRLAGEGVRFQLLRREETWPRLVAATALPPG